MIFLVSLDVVFHEHIFQFVNIKKEHHKEVRRKIGSREVVYVLVQSSLTEEWEPSGRGRMEIQPTVH